MNMSLLCEEEGQTLVEYGLLVSFAALVVIAILIVLGGKVRDVFVRANTDIKSTADLARSGGDGGTLGSITN